MTKVISLSAFLAFVMLCGHGAIAQPADQSAAEIAWSEQSKQLTTNLQAQWAKRVAAGKVPPTFVEPSLLRGRIVRPRVVLLKAPGAPEVELTLDPGTVGVSNISIFMTSPSGAQTIVAGLLGVPAYPPISAGEKLTFLVLPSIGGPSSDFGLYTENGIWTLSQIVIQGNNGNQITYSAKDLASLFPSVAVDIVNRGSVDLTPPTVGAGTIVTPTVSLSGASPVFVASLDVADNLSGVRSVDLSISGPGTGFNVGSYAQITGPLLKGQAYSTLPIGGTFPTGTYTINGFTVCDYAGNCAPFNSAAEVKATFGTTTFQVTP